MDETKAANNKENEQVIQDEEAIDCPVQRGYSPSVWRYIVFYPLAVLPCGIGLLLAYWFPYMWIKLTCESSPLESATYVIMKDSNDKWRVERVVNVVEREDNKTTAINDEEDCSEDAKLMKSSTRSFKYINHQHLRYLLDPVTNQFVLLRGYEQGVPCSSFHSMANGLPYTEYYDRHQQYGSNDINVPVKPYHVLFIEEVLHPFYIFQLFSCLVWVADEYYVYAVAVLIISTVSVVVSLIQTRRHMQHLHDMVKTEADVSVLRNGDIHDNVSSLSIVPGDVLVVPRGGMTMPCDSVLITGNAIVNEAMLTGESVPITKTSLPTDNTEYSSVTHRRHTLFAGTEVIQSRYYSNAPVLAVVVRTGFLTAKGGMVRSILFPKPLNMKFYWDSIKFILILSCLAVVAFIYTFLVLQLRSHPYQIKETILRAFDIITTVVPPSLPAAITVGTVYALNRLKKHNIFCISPQRVILCGKVKLVCFDKTGTLTEDSLDVLGVQPANSRGFSPVIGDPSELSPDHLLFAMTTCHSLTKINGKLSGDPLDMKMFISTKWVLEEPGPDDDRYDTLQMSLVCPPSPPVTTLPSISSDRPKSPWEQSEGPPAVVIDEDDLEDYIQDSSVQLGILKQFTFSSELQRMSVLVSKLPSRRSHTINVYVKGAPEMIKRLSKPDTVPPDYNTVLGDLTQRGYRVIALGYRRLHRPWHHAERLKREEVECDLTFCGFLILENKLKPQTIPVINELQQANIRTVMITGDNLLTAVAVAGNCGMINDHQKIIVIKANKSSVNNRDLPNLTYHVLGTENVNHALLCASSSSVGNYSINNGNDELITKNGANKLYNHHCLQMEHEESFHIAVDGRTFTIIKDYFPELFKRLLVCGTVFARMSPTQKALLVTDLMNIGYGVTMCGDGANDCGALKAAHAGISLSETEASVASPFTSKTPDISCVPHLIREGRDALVTSISVFKFMALYSLTEFTSAATLYAFESNLGSTQYLYVDLILILAFAFVMGLTGPYPRLVKRRPIGTLAGVHVVLSILTQTFIMIAFQIGILFYAKSEPWFEPLQPIKESDNIVCYENAAIFVYANYVYIILAIAFSTAAPYRKPLYTNVMFVLVLLVLLPCNLYMTLAPSTWLPWLWSFIQIKQSPSIWYSIALVEFAGVHFMLAYLLESYIFPSSCMLKFLRLIRCKRKPRNRYKHLLQEVKDDPTWPPPLPTAIPAYYHRY